MQLITVDLQNIQTVVSECTVIYVVTVSFFFFFFLPVPHFFHAWKSPRLASYSSVHPDQFQDDDIMCTVYTRSISTISIK